MNFNVRAGIGLKLAAAGLGESTLRHLLDMDLRGSHFDQTLSTLHNLALLKIQLVECSLYTR